MTDSLILGCPTCNMEFFIEALCEDENGDIPNPVFCPFCASPDLTDDFGIPEVSRPRKTALTVLSGGKDKGGKNGK